jgi:hypothetical protein
VPLNPLVRQTDGELQREALLKVVYSEVVAHSALPLEGFGEGMNHLLLKSAQILHLSAHQIEMVVLT